MKRLSHRPRVQRPHLLLEPLEDRTALSGLGGSSWAPPVPTTAAKSLQTQTYPSSPSSPQAADSTPGQDASYANNTAATTSSGGAGSAAPLSSTTSTSSDPTPGGSDTGTYSSGTSSQTGGTDHSYYSQMGMMDSATQGTMYYPPSDYQQEYAAQAARAAEQTEQAVALRLLPQGQPGTATAAPENQAPPPANTEATSAPAVASTNATATTPAATRTGESQTLPALHHDAAPADAAVALDDSSSDAPDKGASDRLALARLDAHENEPLAPVPAAGGLIAGTAPIDLQELERGVSRFFAHLQEQGQQWLSGPALVSLGSWLAAGAAVTAAFELARRSARAPGTGLGGVLCWQGEGGNHEPELSLLLPDE